MGRGMLKEEGSLIFCSAASTPASSLAASQPKFDLPVQVLVLIVEIFELAVLDHDGGSRLEILHVTGPGHLDHQAVVFTRNVEIEVELVGQWRGLDGVSPAIIFARETEAAAIGIYRAAHSPQYLVGKSQRRCGSIGLRNRGTRSRHCGKIYRSAPFDVGILQGFKQRRVFGDHHQVIFLPGRDIDLAHRYPGHKQDAALMQLRSRIVGGIENKGRVVAADAADGLDERGLLHLHHLVGEGGLKDVPWLGAQIRGQIEGSRRAGP